MNTEATETAALTATLPSTLTDDPEVLAQIANTPYSVFVATIQRMAGTQAPAPGAPVLVKVKGLLRPIRLWMSREGKVGADKPAVVAAETFVQAREAVTQSQSQV